MSKIEDGRPAFPLFADGRAATNIASLANEGMTLRQYAAIKLCVPESGEPWLDDMIREAQRDRFAAAALVFASVVYDMWKWRNW